MSTSPKLALPRVVAAAVTLAWLSPDVSAARLAGTATSTPRVLATAAPRPLALFPPLEARPLRVPGASFTLNPWGPARYGSATPPATCRPSRRDPSWTSSCAPVRQAVTCAPVFVEPCAVYTPLPAGCAPFRGPAPVASFSGGIVLTGTGGGLTISVGLPCGCRSLLSCAHRR